MAKLPLIVPVAPESGPVFVKTIPEGSGEDAAVYFNESSKELVVEKLDAQLFSTTSSDKGLVTGSNGVGAGHFLDATGNWSVPSGGTVESVTASAPLASSGGANPDISLNGVVDPAHGGTGLGAPAAGDAGKVLTSKVDGTYELTTQKLGTVTSVTAGDGLSGGTITNTGTISLPDVGAAGTHGDAAHVPVFVTDSKGRVTGVTDTEISIDGSKVSSGTVGTEFGGTGLNASSVTDGEMLVGQSTGSFALKSMSQDAAMDKDGKVTVKGVQGVSFSATSPSNGQTWIYNGIEGEWIPASAPSSGSGGGGITFYLDGASDAATPVDNLPQTPYVTKKLSSTNSGAGTPFSTVVPNGSYGLIVGFLTDVGVPNIGVIPAGLWDFNIWVNANSQSPTEASIQVRIYTYNTVTHVKSSPIGSSDEVFLYDETIPSQYITSVLVPETSITTDDRIYVEIYGKASANDITVYVHTGGNQPSHVHTSLPSVSGTGIVHVVNGVFQSPATAVGLNSGDVTGILQIEHGGTGQHTLTEHEVLVGNGTSGITSIGLSNNQTLVGITGSGPSAKTLTAGTGIAITYPTSTVTFGIDPLSSPTVAGLTVNGLSVSQFVKTNSSKGLTTVSGIVGSDFGSQSANTFLGAPDAVAGNPSFRTLVSADIPSLDASKLSTGVLPVARGGTNNGSLSASLGSIYYGDGTKLVALAAGTSGQFLKTNGTGAAPEWGTADSVSVPYDIPTEYPGSPSVVDTLLMRFVAGRAFTLVSSATSLTAGTWPAGQNVIATIRRIRAGTTSTVGTITWKTDSTYSVGSWSNIDIIKDDVITVTVTQVDTSNLFANLSFTLGGTL